VQDRGSAFSDFSTPMPRPQFEASRTDPVSGAGQFGEQNVHDAVSDDPMNSRGQKPKRYRRPPDLIDRQYKCDYPGCNKAYGELAHLNGHRNRLEHGPHLSRESKSIECL
jgi:hypothetical protein